MSKSLFYPSFCNMQLAKQLREQGENKDKELLEERNKNIKTIVKSVTSKKKTQRKKASEKHDKIVDNPAESSEYLKMVDGKRNRNKRKLQDLGLVEKTPTTKSSLITRRSPKNSEKKNAPRKIMQSPNSTSKKKNETQKKAKKCPFDHKCFSANYNEENDKRYFGHGYDLFEVYCQGCKKEFTKEATGNCITPTLRAPMYVCQGRQKYSCCHSFCYGCYQETFMKSNAKRPSRRRV